MANLRLTNGKYALVDDEDLALASRCAWQLRNGYVSRCYRKGGSVCVEYLSQFIFGGIRGVKVHFIDRNPLNNQKSNFIVKLMEDEDMGLLTGMRLARVETILAAEVYLAKEMAEPKIEAHDRLGKQMWVAPLTLKVCWALAQKQLDPHKVPKQEVLMMVMKVRNKEVAVPENIAEAAVPKAKAKDEKKPRIIRTADELIRVAQVVRNKVKIREEMIVTLQGEIATLKDELMRNELAARLIAGDIPTAELEQLMARHAPPPNQEEELRRLREMRELRQSQKPAPEVVPTAAKAVWKIVDTRHHAKVLAILMKLQQVGAFHKVDIMSIWNCNKATAYIRFIAQRVPPSCPFLQADGLTVSSAGIADADMPKEVASAICSVPWPPYLSTVVRAREEAQVALKVILNGYGQN